MARWDDFIVQYNNPCELTIMTLMADNADSGSSASAIIVFAMSNCMKLQGLVESYSEKLTPDLKYISGISNWLGFNVVSHDISSGWPVEAVVANE